MIFSYFFLYHKNPNQISVFPITFPRALVIWMSLEAGIDIIVSVVSLVTDARKC